MKKKQDVNGIETWAVGTAVALSDEGDLSMNLGSEGESRLERLGEERMSVEARGEGTWGRKSDEGRGCGLCPRCDRSLRVLRREAPGLMYIVQKPLRLQEEDRCR